MPTTESLPRTQLSNPGLRFDAGPVVGIEPVDGWELLSFPDGHRATPAYVARSAERDVLLDVSRFRFSPSQDRFAWLVRNSFPKRPHPMGGWDDTDIEMRMAVPALDVAA